MEEGAPSDDVIALASLLSTEVSSLRRLLPAEIARVEPPDEPPDYSGPAAWFAVGYPVVVMIGIGEDEVKVGDPELRWNGQTPLLHAREVHFFPRRPLSPSAAGAVDEELARQMRRTRRLRMRRFRRCAECGEMTPPEWRHGPSICQSCAEQNHGVIH